MKRIIKKIKRKLPLCACGCGQPVSHKNNKYILGHNQKTDSSANAGRWQPGQSGNPKGSKKGSRNKASLATENLFLDEGERLTRKCINLALNGNIPALRLSIERICPVRRSSPIKIDGMPRIDKVDDMNKLTGFLLDAISSGKLSLIDAEILSRVMDKHSKSLEVTQLVKRIEELEAKIAE